ncbi:Rrf2 family transcriptional regulator [bacterium]|nr:Rrf2 family transcriptional regulator [bacterium]
MKLFTRNTDYAIRTLGCIAAAEENTVTVTDLTKKLNMPRSFLRKILQLLSSKKLLKSFKGAGGGFSLAVKPEEITLFTVIEIFQGPVQLMEHVFRGKTCPEIKTCSLKKKMGKIEEDLIMKLKSITIIDLLKG